MMQTIARLRVTLEGAERVCIGADRFPQRRLLKRLRKKCFYGRNEERPGAEAPCNSLIFAGLKPYANPKSNSNNIFPQPVKLHCKESAYRVTEVAPFKNKGFFSITVLLALFCFCPAAFWAQTAATAKPSPYRITGTVVSSVDGSPVRRCHLMATLANPNPGASSQGVPGPGIMGAGGIRRGGGPPNRFPASNNANNAVDADDNGHFTLSLPSPGAWTLTASARGYASGAYEQHHFYSSAIVLTPAAPAYDLVFRLPPEASITGIVLDEAGEPVRNAQVALHAVSAPSPDGSRAQVGSVRGFTQTDDRGVYEFANLLPDESFRITVQARPWYTASAQPGRGNVNGNAVTDTSSSLDPSLDVTYPLLWFPGVDDPTQAETISVQAGEVYQADFRLTPIPSIHLRILTPVNADASGRAVPSFPVFERVVPGGGGALGGMPTVSMTPQGGQMEVSGLSPGTYQVHLQSQNGPTRSAVVEITSGSVRTLDMNTIASISANVTVFLDGIADEGSEENSIQVALTDTETGQQFFPANGPANGFGGGGPAGQRRRPSGPSTDHAAQRRGRIIEVPPGRYEVTLYAARSNTYLTAITAQAADVHGRYVTVRAGDSTLTLHLATGLATLTGNVSMHDKPTVGATVLLVPASLGDPGSFATMGRDQSNTDGSFEINSITPGQYILIAIDHGWQINWGDPSTLRRYLTQGIPVDLTSSEKLKQKIEAQSP